MSGAGVAQRVFVALASAVAFAAVHVGALYLYLRSGGSVSREVLIGLGAWCAAPAGVLLLAGLLLALFPSIRYARAFLGIAISALVISGVYLPLAFMDTPRALRDDRFEPNLVFLLMPVAQMTVILIALAVVLTWHLLRRRPKAVA